jgi:hypothetical protein
MYEREFHILVLFPAKSVAPFEFTLYAMPCHGLRFADLFSGHALGDDVSCLRTKAVACDRSKVKPDVSFFVVLNNALAIFERYA